jgi:hypothetical protein
MSLTQRQVARKDVERTFPVLQAYFIVVCGPIKLWDPGTLWKVMTSYVIMHNMIVEDENDGVRQGLDS